jgi:hypothetical protein
VGMKHYNVEYSIGHTVLIHKEREKERTQDKSTSLLLDGVRRKLMYSTCVDGTILPPGSSRVYCIYTMTMYCISLYPYNNKNVNSNLYRFRRSF